MSPRAAKEGKNGLYITKTAILNIIRELLMMTRVAQTHQAGHMRPAGRVFETPELDRPLKSSTFYRKAVL